MVGPASKETAIFFSLKKPKDYFLPFVIIGPNYMCIKILFKAGIFNMTVPPSVLPGNTILLTYCVYYTSPHFIYTAFAA